MPESTTACRIRLYRHDSPARLRLAAAIALHRGGLVQNAESLLRRTATSDPALWPELIERLVALERVEAELPAGTRFCAPLADGGASPALTIVPAGPFTFGSDEDPPQGTAELLAPIALGVGAVTVASFLRFARHQGLRLPDGNDCLAVPVVNVDWATALAYCHWLQAQSGLSFRLPCELEWEAGARGGTCGRHWWGEQTQMADPQGASLPLTTARRLPVGAYPPNPYGLRGVAGAVHEWCLDAADPRPQARAIDPATIVRPPASEPVDRIWRGLPMVTDPRRFALTHRQAADPHTASRLCGFRLALPLQSFAR